MKRRMPCSGVSIKNTMRWIKREGVPNMEIEEAYVYENRWRSRYFGVGLAEHRL
jgi:hypothetical protein